MSVVTHEIPGRGGGRALEASLIFWTLICSQLWEVSRIYTGGLHRHLVMSPHTKTSITKRNISVASSNPNFKHEKSKIYTCSCYLLKQELPLEPRLSCNSWQCYCLSLPTTVDYRPSYHSWRES